jgi:hypothetical protein
MSNASLGLLDQVYRVPSITAYNRLEPRARSVDFERSLRAEVRDPLWMLTRQWQMGELEMEDAASAIDARLVTRQLHVDRIALSGNDGRAYNEKIPMETLVERETVPFTLALKVQVFQYFLALHSNALKTVYLPAYRTVYAIPNDQEDAFRGQTEGLSLYLATRNRALDGEALYKDISTGDFQTKISIAPGDAAAMNGIIQQFTDWFNRQYSQPKQAADQAWHPEQLSYSFAVGAPASPNTQIVLRSEHYHQGRVDWYDFDDDLQAKPLTIDDPAAVSTPGDATPISYIPGSTAFKGMPNPRFWEMEERRLNFGKLNAKTTDHLLLLFAEFGLVYGNDWFVIPYKMAVNTLCEITGFVVTDVFGERTLIQAADAGQDNNWQRWSMFNISNRDNIGAYNRQFFLPSTLVHLQESRPVEQVNFMRDEMANMVWGVEDIIPDATGKGINGHEAADKTGVTLPPIADSTAKIRYALGTTVPENWIPFLPVHIPGSNQDIRFQRAAMPEMGMPPKQVIKPKGVLLQEVKPLYFINEEEIPYSGTIVKRSYHRSRWYNGETFIWIGRYRETGKGEGDSKLAFDQILPL